MKNGRMPLKASWEEFGRKRLGARRFMKTMESHCHDNWSIVQWKSSSCCTERNLLGSKCDRYDAEWITNRGIPMAAQYQLLILEVYAVTCADFVSLGMDLKHSHFHPVLTEQCDMWCDYVIYREVRLGNWPVTEPEVLTSQTQNTNCFTYSEPISLGYVSIFWTTYFRSFK
jgi:hypothetical protein